MRHQLNCRIAWTERQLGSNLQITHTALQAAPIADKRNDQMCLGFEEAFQLGEFVDMVVFHTSCEPVLPGFCLMVMLSEGGIHERKTKAVHILRKG